MHLAIIPDGNRRWAKKKNLHPWKGHEKAVANFREITQWCRNDPRVDILTVWCFSTENWKRDPQEVQELMRMLEDYLRKERKGFMEQRTRFLHSGRRDRIPASLAKLIGEVEKETENQTDFTLHLALDYGGKDELLRAFNRVKLNQPKTLNKPNTPLREHIPEQHVRDALDQPILPDIDLIIRTSGEMRTSNFFLWQSVYAEWVFSEKLFPDFTMDHLKEAMDEYDSRKRRFGS